MNVFIYPKTWTRVYMKINGYLFFKNLHDHKIIEHWFDSNGVKDIQVSKAKNKLLELIYLEYKK